MKRFSLGLCVLLSAVLPLRADDPPVKPAEAKPKLEKPPTIEELLAVNKDLVPSLIVGLKDVNSEVRVTAAHILVNIGKPSVPPLMAALQNADRDMRANAAYALSQFGRLAKEALPALTLALKDEDAEVRRRSAYAISRIMEDIYLQQPELPPAPPMPPPAAPPPGSDGAAQAGWQTPRPLNTSITRAKSSQSPVPDPGVLAPRATNTGTAK